MRDDFCDDVLMMKEKKINRKKTHTRKEERRDLSLSLLASFFTTRLSRLFSELFGFVCSKHSIKVYISYHLHDDRERERERENNKEREKRERGNLSSLSLFVNPKSNPLTFCALDGSLTAANPGVPFK